MTIKPGTWKRFQSNVVAEYQTDAPCDSPREDPQDKADYPDEPRQCVCGWLMQSHSVSTNG